MCNILNSIPTSFTGQALLWAEETNVINFPNKDTLERNYIPYISKPLKVIARLVYGATIVVFVSPVGSIYHVGAALKNLIQSAVSTTNKAELRYRASEHWWAAQQDLLTTITVIGVGTLATGAITVLLGASVPLALMSITVLPLLFGALFSVGGPTVSSPWLPSQWEQVTLTTPFQPYTEFYVPSKFQIYILDTYFQISRHKKLDQKTLIKWGLEAQLRRSKESIEKFLSENHSNISGERKARLIEGIKDGMSQDDDNPWHPLFNDIANDRYTRLYRAM